jgi:hypothetical protein
LECSGRDRASHKQTNDPVKFAQDTGVKTQIVESADGNLNAPGKVAGCHAVLQDKTLFQAHAVDGLGPQVGVMFDKTLIEIACLKLML